MKGTIIGFELVDYVSKKTNEPVKGITLIIAYNSSSVFGCKSKEEFISANSPLYKKNFSGLTDDLDEAMKNLLDASIMIDYEVTRRGNFEFSSIIEMQITPCEKAA